MGIKSIPSHTELKFSLPGGIFSLIIAAWLINAANWDLRVGLQEKPCNHLLQRPEIRSLMTNLASLSLGSRRSPSRLIARDKHWIDWLKQRHVSSSLLVIISDAAPALANWINSQALAGVRRGGCATRGPFLPHRWFICVPIAMSRCIWPRLPPAARRGRIRWWNLLPTQESKRCTGKARWNLFSLWQARELCARSWRLFLMH